MNDTELERQWTMLEPGARQRRRIDARVASWVEAHDTPIAAEWLDLLRAAPFATVGLVAVSALLIAATPLAWFAGRLM